ncbi:type II 3-dehydroquinate dehydratase [Streptomyces sp. SID5606]|nr:type II 3-dehydroquinate dehydratase [Streptomyces sp. SID5606]
MSTVLLLNGPNLGILGRREPEIYGTDTLADIEAAVADELSDRGWKVVSVQHDSEGDLVGAVHRHSDSTVGAIVNPGALMIAGWSLRDALASYPPPWIEVHLSNVWAREQFRHESVIAPLASGVVVGLGAFGYRLAARALLHLAPDPLRPQVPDDGPPTSAGTAAPHAASPAASSPMPG